MFEFFIEYDVNPVIFFDVKGNVKYCNQEAEIFLSYINKKEVFEFAIKNAPKEAIKTEFKDVNFDSFEFKGFSIGFFNDLLGVRFFINTSKHQISIENLEKSNLLKLINFAIEYTTLKQNTKFKIYPDLSLNDLLINKKELLHILLKIFENQKEVQIYTKFKVGEYFKTENKKYPIIDIEIKCHTNRKIDSKYFEVLAKHNGYIIKIPLIKETNENNNS